MIPLEYPSVASLMYILCTIFYSLLYYNMDMQKYVFGKAPHRRTGHGGGGDSSQKQAETSLPQRPTNIPYISPL